jgi:class 3 adenylate cyclase
VAPADHADDIDAVLDALDVAQCDLLAIGDAGFAAVEYCARQNERVTHLILWGAYVTRDAVSDSPKTRSLRALWDEDWLQYTEMAVRTVLGWKHEDRAGQLVDFYRAAASKESLRDVLGPLNATDLTALLPSVQVPTLVVALDDAWLDMRDQWHRLATELPNAELRTAHGETLGIFDFYDEEDAVVTLVNEFLGGAPLSQAPSDDAHARPDPGVLRTVLFTDLVGHTEMMSRLGDERGRDVLREHERITREVLKANGGTEVKTMGDGFMASFGSVTKAVECAVALQKAIDDWNRGVGAQQPADGSATPNERHEVATPLRVRVGLNAGEPIEEDGDLFGATVILASRIAGKADGGEILVADTVRGLCSGKGFLFSDRGEFVAKGFEEPVRVYEVSWRQP